MKARNLVPSPRYSSDASSSLAWNCHSCAASMAQASFRLSADTNVWHTGWSLESNRRQIDFLSV